MGLRVGRKGGVVGKGGEDDHPNDRPHACTSALWWGGGEGGRRGGRAGRRRVACRLWRVGFQVEVRGAPWAAEIFPRHPATGQWAGPRHTQWGTKPERITG